MSLTLKQFGKLIPAALAFFYVCAGTPLPAAETDLNELLSPSETAVSSRTSHASPACSAFNAFNSLIRDGQISKSVARSELPAKLAGISDEYYLRGGRNYSSTGWIFPVAGYDSRAIDKGKKHGFVPGDYDFFSGNRHGGHPAYDIFIRDRNQDSCDDRTGKPVDVLSMTGGIVVALEKEWQQGSGLRGGKYLWIYDPANSLLVYYAHNEDLFVGLGDMVKPGDLLATVGRSGLNAAKKRSPTHLHFSVLRIRNGLPAPVPVYRELERSTTKKPSASPEG